MKIKILIFFLFTAISAGAFAQCGLIEFNNPGLEGTPGPNKVPTGWNKCMSPDIQPGIWNINLPPHEGSSYVELIATTAGSWPEAISQDLPVTLIAGTTYNFFVALAVSSTVNDGTPVPPGCVALNVYAGNSGTCSGDILLWTSGNIYDVAHTDHWVVHQVSFTAPYNITRLKLANNNLGCVQYSNILIDDLVPIPPDTINFTADTVCVGLTTTFTNQSFSPGGGTFTQWTWDFGDGSPVSHLENPVHNFPSSGIFDVELTAVSSMPCTTTFVRQVYVSPGPTVSITASNNEFCVSGTSTLSATGANTYSWMPGSLSGSPVTVSPTITTTYTVTGNKFGCIGTDTVTITVHPIISAAASPDTICAGDATLAIATGAETYSWMPGSFTNDSVSVSPSTTTTYSITGNINGCITTNSLTLVVNPRPVINDIAINGCTGVPFSLVPVNGTNGIVPAGTLYTWAAPNVVGINGEAAGTNAADISGLLVNTTLSPINVVYTVTPSTPLCTGPPFTVTVTVNPNNTIALTSGAGTNVQTKCINTAIT
ncbi:MAG TPA: PKD domain-containing protein, partial [Bacteroidales bacterium]|nr:PKD domain-containing protein [Bacteroidales bacterium]